MEIPCIAERCLPSSNHMKVHSEKLVQFIEKNKVVSSSDVAKFLKVSWNTADRHLMNLVIEGKIERIKKEGMTLWMIR